MEKRKPHHSLTTIKATFSTVEKLRMTDSASDCALLLGIDLVNVVTIIQEMKGTHFYKSMTSFADNTIWQDVYHVPYGEIVLYVKFTTDDLGYLVISFKEK